MEEKGAGESAKPSPTAAEKQLLRRRQELDYWKKNAARLRSRNLLTGLAIGAFVVGMCILHRLSWSDRCHKLLHKIDQLCPSVRGSDFFLKNVSYQVVSSAVYQPLLYYRLPKESEGTCRSLFFKYRQVELQ